MARCGDLCSRGSTKLSEHQLAVKILASFDLSELWRAAPPTLSATRGKHSHLHWKRSKSPISFTDKSTITLFQNKIYSGCCNARLAIIPTERSKCWGMVILEGKRGSRGEVGRGGVRIGRGYFFHIRSHAKLSCSHGEWLDLKETPRITGKWGWGKEAAPSIA